MTDRRRWWRLALGVLAAVLALVLVLLLAPDSDHHPRTASTRRGSPPASTTGAPAPPATSSTPGSTTPAAALAPARPAPAGVQFGASVNLVFNTFTNTPQLIATQLDALRATGVTIARSDAFWEASEPSAPASGVHSYTWMFDDTVAGDLAAHHLRWLPIIDYSAPWARSIPGQQHSPPSSSADYASYAAAFAMRYGSRGSFWREHPKLPAEPVQTYEIWNEPDLAQFWTPTPDAARYADLYIAARMGIDAVDPAARVVVGGLTNPTGFLPAVLAARPGLGGHVDGVAVHPYGTPHVLLAKIRADRAMLVALGMGQVPLYVTEFGWTTLPPGALNYVPSGRRPDYISETVAALGHLDCGLAASVLYTWYSPQRDPADSEQWFGIDSLTGVPTRDTAAFEKGLRRAQASGETRRICG